MNFAGNVFQAILHLCKQLWRLPKTIANAGRDRRRLMMARASEAERLDRIRNPSKYLGI